MATAKTQAKLPSGKAGTQPLPSRASGAGRAALPVASGKATTIPPANARREKCPPK